MALNGEEGPKSTASSLGAVVVGLDEMRRAISGVTYPCVSMSLIAIYREF